MSLLTICQGVARAIKIEVPPTIINNNSDESNLLLQCAQDEGEALARRPPGGWISMIREFDFTTIAYVLNGNTSNNSAVITGISDTSNLSNLFGVSGTNIPANTYIQSVDSPTQVTLNNAATGDATATPLTFGKAFYPLPTDFQRPIDGTMWDRTRYWAMRGPMDPQQWQFFKSTPFARATIQRRFRFMRRIGADQPTDYFAIDPVPNDNATPLVFEYVSNAWCQSSLGVPQTQWLADSDTGIVDEYLLRMGVKWRALDRLGVAYQTALAEYEREVDKALAHDGGAGTLDMTPYPGQWLLSYMNVQEGNFPSGTT